MEILYGKKETKIVNYLFTINEGGDLGIKISNGDSKCVTIIFVDDKFKEAKYFPENSDRNYWHIVGAISQKIKEIEDGINAPTTV